MHVDAMYVIAVIIIVLNHVDFLQEIEQENALYAKKISDMAQRKSLVEPLIMV